MNYVPCAIMFASVGEAHVRSVEASKTCDPFLKSYFGTPLASNDNINVKKTVANETMCEF